MTQSVKGPIFIMGFPRSGTTGLATALGQLEGFNEFSSEGHFIYLFSDAINRITTGRVNQNCVMLDPDAQGKMMEALAGGIDAAYRAISGVQPLQWIDKTPDISQVMAVPAIMRLFPQAWFFYIYREPLSSVRSNVATWPKILTGKEIEVANRWVRCQSTWRQMRSHIPENQRIEIVQSELRDNPEPIVDRICALLGLGQTDLDNIRRHLTENRSVNRPASGKKAEAYSAFDLSEAIKAKVAQITADEAAHWA